MNAATFALVAAILLTGPGCFGRKKTAVAERPPSAFTVKSSGARTNVVSVPTASSVGRVASVNGSAKFAVINFPIGQVPPNDTRLSVFRGGMKVGEIKITGPAQDTFTVGDIVSGSAQDGDEVRAE